MVTPAAASPSFGRARGFVAVAALAVPVVFWPLSEQAFALPKLIALTLTVSAALITLLRGRESSSDILRAATRHGLPGILMFASAALSLLVAGVDLQGSLGELGQFQGVWSLGLYVTAWLLGYVLYAGATERWRLAEVHALAGLVVAAYACLQIAGVDPIWHTLLAGRATSTIGQPNAMAAFLGTSLPFAVAMAWRASSLYTQKSRHAWTAVAALSSVGLVSGGSRGGVLGLVVGSGGALGALALTRSRSGPGRVSTARTRSTVLSFVAVGTVSVLVLFAAPERTRETLAYTFGRGVGISDAHSAESAVGHLELWSIGMRMAADHPFVGVGPERFPLEFPAYRDRFLSAERRAAYLPFRVESPHNVYIAWAAGIGFPGALLYLSLIGVGVAGLVRAISRSDRGTSEAILLLAMLAAVLTHVVTDAFMTAEISSTWVFWLLLGVATRAGDLASPSGSARSARSARA